MTQFALWHTLISKVELKNIRIGEKKISWMSVISFVNVIRHQQKKSATLNESLTHATWLHLNSTPAHHTCGKCKAYNGTTKSVFNQDLGAQGTPWKIFIMHQEKRYYRWWLTTEASLCLDIH